MRINVLWSNVIASLIILISAYSIYRLFLKVVVQAVWSKNASLLLTGLFFTASMGFFLAKLGELMANDFLMKPSEIGCPLFSSITSSYYLKAAIGILLFDPLFMMVVLLMALISAFLRYSYGLKEENDSFI